MSEYMGPVSEKVGAAVVVLRLPQPMLAKIDASVGRGEHLTRSEAIRVLIARAQASEATAR
jgi:Arc/MetJ-type ribon-helix-helix transcriptional regulator